MSAQNFFKLMGDGALVFVRASPGAAKDEIAGQWQGAGDEPRLAVKVAAPPDKGKANAAIIKLLAKALGVAKSTLSVSAGETARLKTVTIIGDPAVLEPALRRLIDKSS
jgi:uncharacterized protein